MSAPGNTAPPPVIIAPVVDDEWRYIASTWIDSHHRSAKYYKHPYKRSYLPLMRPIVDTLARESKALVARNPDGRAVGWIVYTPGRSIATVHYVYARHKLDDVPWRRRGVATALLQAAELGRRFVYTFPGEYRRASMFARGLDKKYPRPLDEELVDSLRRRGVTAVYEPVERWMSP